MQGSVFLCRARLVSSKTVNFDLSVNSISCKKPKCTSSGYQEHLNWGALQVHLGVWCEPT